MGKRGRKPYADIARREAMAARYRSGETLQQIGDSYGLTRERIRQLIGKLGLNGKDSGRRAQSDVKKALRRFSLLTKRDERTQQSFGCSYSQLIELNLGEGPRKGYALRYKTQHKSAGTRGVEWDISFPDWLRIWSESGHLAQRGIGRGRYVMARIGDAGPYTVGNVYITTADDNVRDYQAELKTRGVDCPDGYRRLPERAHQRSSKPARVVRGWSRLKHGGARPYQVKYGRRYIGAYPTQEAAEAAYAAAKQAAQHK